MSDTNEELVPGVGMPTPDRAGALEVMDCKRTQSPEIGKVLAAMFAAWSKFPKIPRNAVGKVFKNGQHQYDWKYATLDDIYDAIREHLIAVGLLIMHRIVQIEGDPRSWIFTQIWHAESEQWIGQWQPLREAEIAQQFGSQLTYRMRYGLCAILGIVPADDDDGNSDRGQDFARNGGERRESEKKPPQQPSRQAPEPPPENKPDPPASAKVSTRYPPPPRKALEDRIEKLASPQEVVDFAENCIGYDAVAQNPATWPFIAVALFRHIQAGIDAGGWDRLAADEAADQVRGIWPDLAKSAIEKFNTADQLLEWIIELGRKPPRNPGQWRQIVLLAGNTAAQKLEAGWTPATCEEIGTECAKQSRRIKAQLEALTKTEETKTDGRDQSTNQEHPAENGQGE